MPNQNRTAPKRATRRQPESSQTQAKTEHHAGDSLDRHTLPPLAELQRNIGNQATLRMVNDGSIQRLMSADAFKASTVLSTDSGFKGLFSKGRNKVDAIDTALTAFHAIGYDQGAPKLTALDAVITACTTYMALGNKQAKRKGGVGTLLAQANAERPWVQQSVPIFAAANSLAKARQMVLFQDQLVPLVLNGTVDVNALNLDVGRELSICVAGLSAQDKQDFIQDDINRLTAMSTNNGLPQITRDVLTEVLANLPQIDLGAGPSGAGLTNKGPTDPKYFVMNTTNRMMGTGERLGSLAHELTHVSISESYSNTNMMWAFNAGLSDDQIKTLSDHRVNQLDQLLALIDGIPGLHDSQKNRMKEQLAYAKRPNLMADANALSAPQLTRFNDLAANGVNWSALVEFDTNVNQCLILMASWGVAHDEPFHTLLQAVAQEAYDARQAG